MGYTTEFTGSVSINPPLQPEAVAFINKFSDTRRMNRKKGPYYCGKGFAGQSHESDIIDYNEPPPGQPGLWCQWNVSDDGCFISWNGAEKFYSAAEWMQYVIDYFIKPGCLALGHVAAITGGSVVNGEIKAQGDDPNDRWLLVVVDNVVSVEKLK